MALARDKAHLGKIVGPVLDQYEWLHPASARLVGLIRKHGEDALVKDVLAKEYGADGAALAALILIHEHRARLAIDWQQAAADEMEAERLQIGHLQVLDRQPLAEPGGEMDFLVGKDLDGVADFAGIDEESVLCLLRQGLGRRELQLRLFEQGRAVMAAQRTGGEDRGDEGGDCSAAGP